MLWLGSAASYVDLNPTGFTQSLAFGAGVTQQVGSGYGGTTGNTNHALLWTGTAASYVDLNPPGFTVSDAFGTNGTQQVGYGTSTAIVHGVHALLWTGSAASYIDLNPTGFSTSEAFATGGAQQVGFGINSVTSNTDALLWSGSASSYVDLGAVLPSTFNYSVATSIDGNIVYGYAKDTGGNYHSIEWTVTVPEPAVLSLIALATPALLARRKNKSREN